VDRVNRLSHRNRIHCPVGAASVVRPKF
jgi:hypothetical protein